MKEKKIGFFSVTCLAIGTIVGAGVFGTIPAAAGIVGTGIEWAYFIAFISILICYIPQMVTISVLPAPFTFYMHTTRLVHPTAGYMLVIFGFNYVFILSALAGVFAEYASVYIPVDHRTLGVGALLFFAFITSLGVKANAIAQNIMVVSLFSALFLYVFVGMPEIRQEFLSFGDIIKPENLTIVTLGSAVALLSASLQGGVSIAFYPEKIKNPGKTIPRAFVWATAICCFVFMLVSAVTIGVLPMEQVSSLLDVAKIVFSPGMYHFFILAGAIFSVLTSLNGIFIAGGNVGSATAEDKVMPMWFGRLNKHEVPKNTVWLLAGVSSVFVAFGFPIGTLLTAYSLLNLFCLLLLFIPALKVHKLYPNSFRAASFKIPPQVTAILSLLGVGICIWQLVSTLITLDMKMIVTIVIWYAIWYAFYFGRRRWLKNQGFDLDRQMRLPYPEWVEREKELSKIAEKKKECETK